ncbi:hypothetical protein C6497_01150 [Candidatus Poribacteria bacterium]|nr:MAG: hypothetical protein C6497_01150 [Candidatus Poribacteria bacterium]
MNQDSNFSEPVEPSKHRKSRFVPFCLLIIIAVAIGIGIRYYRNIPQTLTETGTWQVYFNDVGKGNISISLEERLIDKLKIASVRIDAALYDLDSQPIADALIKAHQQNVKVRIFAENDNVDEEEFQKLKASGIPVLDDGDNEGLMHHKFFVIDERYVWTGSYNLTYRGANKNNNNVVWIDSPPLAMNYSQEFRELFVLAEYDRSSDPNVPFPRIMLNDGTEILTYFAPDNDTISPLLKEIESATSSIVFMAFSFTHDELGKAMQEQYKMGIAVNGIFDANQKKSNRGYSEFDSMKKAGLSVRLDKEEGAMHHKVIIIDEETVITGSYNFSKNAETRNSENLLIIKGNKEIASAYLDEFNRIK